MRLPTAPKALRNLVLAAIGIVGLGFAFQNCSGYSAYNDNMATANGLSSTGVPQVQLSLKVRDASGAVVYDDSVSNSSLKLKDGQAYTFDVSSASPPPTGASLVLNYTDLSVIGAAPKSMKLDFGSNVIPAGTIAVGTYQMKFEASAPGMVDSSKTYNAAMTCSSPTFTANSLNANGVSVSGITNMYSISVAGVVAGANGVGPYMCALDQTGSSILDSAFADCSVVFAKQWSNYVASRNVHVAVRDACQIVQQVSAYVNLPYLEPAVQTQVPFVFGVTSNATGTAASDSRTNNLTYLATNQSPNIDVQSNLNGSSFTIQASHNYKENSSVDFGVKIQLAGLVNTVSPSGMSGSVDVSNARISALQYSTDESGDTQVALSFSSASCVLSNQQASVRFVAGPPCSSSAPGDQNAATVEISGHYKCTNVASSAGSFTIEGDFDGLEKDADSCVGGSGGSGGGIVPINF